MKKEVKNKKITNIELLESINRSFSKVEAKIDTKVEELKIEIEGVKNQLVGTNKRIDDFVVTRVKYEDHNKLKDRVDFIEKKLEIKS
ncbi:hypothetical protein A2641_02485 [Candidatus Nomurabacteria bacterium RIFCSPHIGHO2_01_FULL_37_25]|uniref:Uncharacterized protein n=1 Tax=Candidatus Nomurabacteria bacterium RIFCSPLOWO2_01_FULL_36_16 TaxID=1801767 RepID=A0A1F6X0H7_9BACT|nr:MAG: hypothetical protein A2641_02485 [Candidatus Nomurabacteria bacterium RIFCSPHIGHO2_01_FULL_37_25]OGI75023.1 MAG: hypothetical protein A3D36_03230 [Candidatus Nomurabacteria bacterium RIFCSPHIGHO2_02_FULL_36_29]OGI87534.1 MAG: hypothetical protein A3A91_01300 [Candidatus Nomurabacteria bacterium RIFCSPLOWO2_01_FULL_36_16]OGI95094.1 MAG: hypothetical protein A3I84_02195 [Candidatus Nomurabacteria bacterium RIFCSPLOWO2_02_FULL_36_8]